jgi:hypothetical protein
LILTHLRDDSAVYNTSTAAMAAMHPDREWMIQQPEVEIGVNLAEPTRANAFTTQYDWQEQATSDTSSDDGLDLPQTTISDENEAHEEEAREEHAQAVRCIFYQDPDITSTPDTTPLWQVPVTDDSARALQQVESEVGHLFVTIRKDFQKRWQCTPSEALPHVMHDSTPYSLELLRYLWTLSSVCEERKVHMQAAHAALVKEWQLRLARMAVGAAYANHREFYVYKTNHGTRKTTRYCEKQIHENRIGLTVSDVRKVQADIGKSGGGNNHVPPVPQMPAPAAPPHMPALTP